ncbi:MAG: periplasmic heavy metal sensor [Nitrospirae bacterium]|nr:periplasmic heavy metal sensor [Nitrospirota bacterium]
MKKMLLIPLTVAFLLALTVSGDAVMGDMGFGQPHMMGRMMSMLGLDKDQAAAVAAIHFKTRKDVIKKRAEIDVARIELGEIVTKDVVDMKAAEAKIRQIESIRSDIHMLHLKAREDVKSKLTPQQKEQFKTMTEARRMRGGMKMGMPGYPPPEADDDMSDEPDDNDMGRGMR